MILLRNLRLMPGEPEDVLKAKVAAALGMDARDVMGVDIVKKSLDARKKQDIHFEFAVHVSVACDEAALLKKVPTAEKVSPKTKFSPKPIVCHDGARPVVIGFGPAGMFAALFLAMANAKPIVLERGCDAQTRVSAVLNFWHNGLLDAECNVQFGEGGAGTFSDGKLTTGIKDLRVGFVLESLIRFGAPENIRYDAKPHIGTDVLVRVVQNLRREIIALGGEVRFGHKVTAIETEHGAVVGVIAQNEKGLVQMASRQVVFAIGHSARDTFEILDDMGINMQPKGFSMGVRIEHSQTDIDAAQYNRVRGVLPPADYKLACKLPDGNSAYTFCMCPGGVVVAAASEKGGVVTNGMSYANRGGKNANAALLVTLTPADFPDDTPLGGMRWQRMIEKSAFEYAGGNYRAPAQLAGDFFKKKPSTGPGSVHPTYRPGVFWGDLRTVLPQKITDTIALSLPLLARKLHGFDHPDAVLTAPETRSSSPVRVMRNERLQSSAAGLYPCGEGAGYAGGITSAAVDGLRCAEALLEAMQKDTMKRDGYNKTEVQKNDNTFKTNHPPFVRVVAALIWCERRFLICRRPQNKARGMLWEFVGGKVEPKETDRAALMRECREELGVDIAAGELYMQVTHPYPDLTVQLVLYHAAITRGTPQKYEHDDLRWITADETDGFDFCPADTEILQKIKSDTAAGLLPPR